MKRFLLPWPQVPTACRPDLRTYRSKGSIGMFLLLCFLHLLVLPVSGQNRTVQGKVFDESGVSLPGVSIRIKDGSSSAVTNVNGEYTISVLGGKQTLIFNFLGFDSQEIEVNGRTTINVTMKSNATSLNEVVVVGYTAQKKSTLTGAVGTLSMDDVDKRRVPDVAQVLQGQVAGVQVTQSTGAPGDPISIRIRGEGTIGNNNPLYVIDGVPSRDITFLNPADISSMTVLKDASAASIYGSRAAAGVVVITTRQGQKGRTSFSVNYYDGFQNATNLPQMLNSSQYLQKLEEAWNNSGYTGTNPYTAERGRADLANTDWLDALFEFGHSRNIEVTANGGTDKVQFLLSGGLYKQDGIVVYENDAFKRINFRSNITANLTPRLTVGTNLLISNSMQDALSSKGDAPGIIRHALLRPPVIPVNKDPNDPTYSVEDPFTDLPFYNNGTHSGDKYQLTSNPIALAYFANDKRKNFKTFGNIFGEYSLLQDNSLKFRSNLGVDLNFNQNKAFGKNFGDDDGGGNALDRGLGRHNRPNFLSEVRGEEITFTWNNTLNYQKTFGKHSINAMTGSEFITNSASGISASRARYEFERETSRYIDFGGTAADVWNGGSGSEWSLFSLFGSATYVFNSKYMVTANFRADASSRFAENNRWGYFPSVSAGWVLSEEKFLKDVEWLSDLKLRVSTGQLGNQEIDNYAFMTLLRKDGDKYVINRYGNPDLKWETTHQNNIGFDLGLFRNRFTLSADYFQKTTSGILLPVSLPKIIGDVKPTYVNAGEVLNKGFEVAASLRNTIGNFRYSVNGNLATLTNRVEKLHPNLPSIAGQVSKTEVGQPLNSYFGYVMEGIYQNTAEIQQHLHGSATPSAVPGDIRFRDLDGNGIINDNDRTFLGSAIPALTYGLNLAGAFKGFDLSVLFQGVQGVDRYNDSKKILDYDTRPFNHTTRVLNSWSGPGSTNTIPRVSFTDNGSSRISSIYVEDASYLRLKNLELGYSLGSVLKKTRLGVQNVRVYISGQNLFTKTDYTGMDAESVDLIDMGTYPQSKAYMFGVNLNF